jgi:hypothetical protein
MYVFRDELMKVDCSSVSERNAKLAVLTFADIEYWEVWALIIQVFHRLEEQPAAGYAMTQIALLSFYGLPKRLCGCLDFEGNRHRFRRHKDIGSPSFATGFHSGLDSKLRTSVTDHFFDRKVSGGLGTAWHYLSTPEITMIVERCWSCHLELSEAFRGQHNH